ncbi:MAG: arylsulfatase [Mucilaginibacter sp.]|uniref:arylsulfatase n=1 Tax=Mucilaginibacter sp. TaxID=1882438 RepID=UPI0031A8E5EC
MNKLKIISTLSIFSGILAGWGHQSALAQPAKKQPNIILILADDMGFSDIGCYGGLINTPNLDELAAGGIRFTQFYNGARCCPTRASLLTGLYAQQAGIGYMTEKLGKTEAYQGHIRKEVKTVADYMKVVGYTTMQVGKWHVGNVPNRTMPMDKGFEKAWTQMAKVDYWNPSQIYIDGKVVKPQTKPGDYLTDTEGDEAIADIDYAKQQQKPFFMYLAFNSAHWPLHAKPQDIAKYRGKFMKGWDALQADKIKKLNSIGLIQAIDRKKIKDPALPAWTSYPKADAFPGYHPVTSPNHDQDDWDLQMSVYAAQIDNMDQNIGRLVAKLKAEGIYENTIIMFLQDNGACAEAIGKNDANIPGTPGSYVAYGLPWANLSNTPFKMYKHFVHEGGISTPFIFHWPAGLANSRKGAIEKNNIGHIIDLVPTCIDAAGDYSKDKYPNLEGQSLLSAINGTTKNNERTLYWEHEGNRAIRFGDWKLVSRYEGDFKYFMNWGWKKTPRTTEWELYNIKTDRWELNDVAAQHKDLVASMIKKYGEWYTRVEALPFINLIKGSKFENNEN